MNSWQLWNLLLSKAHDKTYKFNYIASYIIEQKDDEFLDSINIFAQNTHTSVSTIHRFIREIGVKSFSEFKFILKKIILSKDLFNNRGLEFSNIDSNEQVVTTIVTQCLKDISKVEQEINEQLETFEMMTSLFINANKILLIGVGTSFYAGEEFKAHLISIGLNCDIVYNIDDFVPRIFSLGVNDLLFVISYSGLTTSILEMLNKIPEEREFALISLTGDGTSPVAIISDYSLVIGEGKIKGDNIQIKASMTTHLTLSLLWANILKKSEKYQLFLKKSRIKK